MGRPPRSDHPDAVALVTNRGTAQTMIYRCRADRADFIASLGKLEARFGVAVIAFVLMGNHYHLIVRSSDGRLSEAMHVLDGGHARRFNARHGRHGALFQGRYDARPIQTERGFQRAGHYVHLNPFRAGLVRDPLCHRWSSFPSYARGATEFPWLRLELLDGGTGAQYLEGASAVAGELVDLDLPIDDDGWEWWGREAADHPVVADAFASSDRAVAAAFASSVDEIYVVAPGRANVLRTVGIVHAARTTGASVAEVANRYGLRTTNSVHAKTRRLRELIAKDPEIAGHVSSLGLRI